MYSKSENMNVRFGSKPAKARPRARTLLTHRGHDRAAQVMRTASDDVLRILPGEAARLLHRQVLEIRSITSSAQPLSILPRCIGVGKDARLPQELLVIRQLDDKRNLVWERGVRNVTTCSFAHIFRTLNASCSHLVKWNGTRWPRCSASDDGPWHPALKSTRRLARKRRGQRRLREPHPSCVQIEAAGILFVGIQELAKVSV